MSEQLNSEFLTAIERFTEASRAFERLTTGGGNTTTVSLHAGAGAVGACVAMTVFCVISTIFMSIILLDTRADVRSQKETDELHTAYINTIMQGKKE